MAEKPIPFTIDEVKATLEGRKSQTRRVIKPQPEFESGYDYPHENELGIYWKREESYSSIDELIKELVKKCPYQPGDILWARETWQHFCLNRNTMPNRFAGHSDYCYKATVGNDCCGEGGCKKWRSSAHMPREAARIFLRVKNVRVERLQDITEEDARAEGCMSGLLTGKCTARGQFEDLWDSINAKRGYGWDMNPFCWVVEFEWTPRP